MAFGFGQIGLHLGGGDGRYRGGFRPGSLWQYDFVDASNANRVWTGAVKYDTEAQAMTAGAITVSRASTVYIEKLSGLLQSFPSNALPMTDKGLLCEGAATNLITYARDFTNAAWVKPGCAATGGQVGADGTNAASMITDNPNVNSFLFNTYVTASQANLPFSVSVYMKGGTKPGNVTLSLRDGAFVTTASTVVTPSASYQRVSASGTFGAAPDPNILLIVDPVDEVSAGTYYLDFAQLEAGLTPTSPIVTTSGTATRAASFITIKPVTGTYDIHAAFSDGTTSVIAASRVVGVHGYVIPTNISQFGGKYITSIWGTSA